jgi:hypothetical protein
MNQGPASVRKKRTASSSLVLLFYAASEAEQRRDVDALTHACVLAKRLAEVLGEGLAADPIRLLDLCNELLARVHAVAATPSGRARRHAPVAGASSKAAPSAAALAENSWSSRLGVGPPPTGACDGMARSSHLGVRCAEGS